jgi:putative spermidine/putrescine transport system ATP-binding protein
VGRDGDRLIVEIPGGHRILATAAGGVADASHVILSVRPERVSLEPASCDNRLSLPLESVVYLGDSSRLVLALPGGSEFTIKTGHSSAHSHLVRGQEIAVGWNAEDCRTFPNPVA